jgi:hypothetical protein
MCSLWRSAARDSVATVKLDAGRVFERSYAVYRDQFALLAPAALIVFVPISILNGLILSGAIGVAGVLLIGAIGVVGNFWYQGMVVEAAQDIMDGRRDHTVGTLFASVTPVLWPLIAAGVLAGIAIGIGFVLIVVPGLILLTIWALLAPVIVLERPGVIPSFGRSRELVHGNGWQVFSVIVVLFVIQFVVSGVVVAITTAISSSFVGYSIGDLIARVLIAPLTALAAAIMYFELSGRGGRPASEPAPASPAQQPPPER